MNLTTERLAALFSTMTEGALFHDTDGRIEQCNESAERILGRPAAELVGRTWTDPCWRPVRKDGSAFPVEEDPALAALATGEPRGGIVLGIHGSAGSITWISVNSRPVGGQAVVSTFVEVKGQAFAGPGECGQKSKLDAALASIPDAVFMTDAEGRIVYFNDAWVKFLRFDSRRECLEYFSDYPARFEVLRPGGEIVPTEQWAVPRALRGETALDQQYIIRRVDTGETWMGSYSFAPFMEEGAIAGAVVSVRDITAQKRMQESLRESEQNHRALFENMTPGAFFQRADGVLIDCNPAFLRMSGLTREEFLARTSHARQWRVIREDGTEIPPEDHPSMAALRTGQPVRDQVAGLFNPQSGGYVWLSVNAIPLFRPGEDQPYQVFVTLHDITRIRQYEEERRNSESLHRSLFDHSLDSVILSHIDGTITAANPAACRMFRATEQELRFAGRDFIVDQTDSRFQTTLETLSAVGKVRAEMTMVRKDGEKFEAEVSSAVIDGAGRAFVIIRDITGRKQAEEALRDSERKYRVVAENTYDWEYWLDQESRFLYCSPSCERITGHSQTEFTETPELLRQIVHPEDRAFWDAHGRDASRGVPCGDCEFKIIHPDGTVRWIGHVCQPVFSEEGVFQGVRASNRDVTERRKGEDALREGLLFRREAERIAHIGAWKVSPRTDYLYWTEGVYEILEAPLDYKPGLAEGLKFYDAESLPALSSALALALEDGTPFVMEVGLTTFTGRHIWTEVRGLGRIEEHGESFVMGTFQDVTSRREAETVRRDSELKYRHLYESITDAVVAVDMTGRIVECNPAYEAMLNYTAGELCRLNYHQVTPPRWHEMEARIVAGQVLPRGFSDVYEKEYLRKDGTIVPVEMRRYLLRDEADRPMEMWAIVRDISARKQAEEEGRKLQEQLAQAQKMESIGRLAGGVAHDFNNLLTIITGYSEMALSGLRTGDPLRRPLEAIDKAGERAAGLTRQLLAFSRRQVLQPRVLNLNQVVLGMESMLRRLIGDDVILELTIGPSCPAVNADQHQLEQVIMNLVVNARDAMPRGGTILIETGAAEERGHALLKVSDNGIGMDEETRMRAFEPFFTTKEVGRGTGLGLSMVQGIVAQSGGYVEVDSEQGRGTSFRIYLPAVEERPPAGVSTSEAEPSRGKERILVVEDQPDVLDFVVLVLSSCGYQVLQAATAAAAQAVFEREGGRIDLLLTDVMMPQMSGLELANRLRQSKPGLRILFMSGYSGGLGSKLGEIADGSSCIQKPLRPRDLSEAVRGALDRR